MPQYNPFKSRQEAFLERYGRMPTANELRALAETHRKKLSRLNDDSEAGRQIYNLLLKCERDNDISGLEEAGQLLWGQVFQRPEADRSRDVTYENNDYETQDRGEFTYDNPTDFSDSDSIPEFSSSETSEDEESPVCSMDDSDLGAGSDEAFPTAPIDFPPASSLPCRQASTPTYGFSSRGSQTPHSSSRKGLLTAQKEKSSPATLRDIITANIQQQSSLVCPNPKCPRSKGKPFVKPMTLSTHILKFHQDIYPPTGIATEYGKRLPGGDYESRKSRKDKNPGIQDGSSMAINDVTTRNYNDIDPSLLYNAQPYLSPYNASTITPGGNNQGGLVPASICYSTQAVPTPQGNVVIQNELNSSMVDNQEWRIRSWNLAQNAAVEAQLSQLRRHQEPAQEQPPFYDFDPSLPANLPTAGAQPDSGDRDPFVWNGDYSGQWNL